MTANVNVEEEILPAEASRPAKRRMRNVTVTMEEGVAKWARMEAARREMSVSRLMGELVREKMARSDSYQRAMERALARPALPPTERPRLTREELYDRPRIR